MLWTVPSLIATPMSCSFHMAYASSGVGGSMNILFRADLSRYVAHRPSVLYWVLQPGADVGGIGMGLVRMVRPWYEWLIVWGYDITQPPPVVDAALATQVARQLVGDPALEIELLSANTWTVNNMYATRLQRGRVFIMGDAAHRHPPSNGLGSNTSIQDAFNLAWKLALVLRGSASERLLDSYEAERRPIGMRNVDWAMFTALNHGVLDAGMGFSPVQTPELRRANFAAFFADTPMGATRRARAAEVFATQRTEFQAHDLEIGYAYETGALCPDGSAAPARDPLGTRYVATTRPGHRLPHAWLLDAGRRVSTLDLSGHSSSFVLLTTAGGKAWREAASHVFAARGVPLRVVTVDGAGCEDAEGRWADLRGVDDDGAVLVRPDNHVAWRHAGAHVDPATEMQRVAGALLGG